MHTQPWSLHSVTCCVSVWRYMWNIELQFNETSEESCPTFLTYFLKSRLLVLPHQSTSVFIPTSVCYSKCASNRWRYSKFDYQHVRQRCHTDRLHARSICEQLLTQHEFPYNFPYKFWGQCFLSIMTGSVKKYNKVLRHLSVVTLEEYWGLLWSTAVCYI